MLRAHLPTTCGQIPRTRVMWDRPKTDDNEEHARKINGTKDKQKNFEWTRDVIIQHGSGLSNKSV